MWEYSPLSLEVVNRLTCDRRIVVTHAMRLFSPGQYFFSRTAVAFFRATMFLIKSRHLGFSQEVLPFDPHHETVDEHTGLSATER